MAKFRKNLIEKLGEDNLLRIETVKVGLAGAGGLGSNCAASLVRVGFKKLKIVDFDVVEEPNLDRQFYFFDQVGKLKVEALMTNLLKISPQLELSIINKKIDETNVAELFSDCDIIVECLDKAESKKMLASGLISSGKLIVSASGLGGFGASDEIKVHKIKDNLIIIGDLTSGIDSTPALSPRVNIAAAKQADTVLEFVLNSLPRT